jgi:hypothetical protein
VVALLTLLLAAPAQAGSVVHVPPREAPESSSLEIAVANGDVADMSGVELFYRTRKGDWHSLGFSRTPAGAWIAVVPAEDVRGPWLEYYLASDEGQRARFASAEEPCRVALNPRLQGDLAERELTRFDGQRTRFEAGYQWLDQGAPSGLEDTSWQGHFQVTYRPLGVVRSLHFGFSRMRGQSLERRGGELIQSLDGNGESEWGLDQGWAELEFRAAERFSVSPRLVLGGNNNGFTAGGGGALRIGLDPGTNLRIYGQYVGRGTGGMGGVALAWDTVPHVPMSAGVEVGSWPNDRLYGVRLRYDLEVPVGKNAALLGGASYQARTTNHGALGFRGGLSWSF